VLNKPVDLHSRHFAFRGRPQESSCLPCKSTGLQNQQYHLTQPNNKKVDSRKKPGFLRESVHQSGGEGDDEIRSWKVPAIHNCDYANVDIKLFIAKANAR
jgi:hypothetical protein